MTHTKTVALALVALVLGSVAAEQKRFKRASCAITGSMSIAGGAGEPGESPAGRPVPEPVPSVSPLVGDRCITNSRILGGFGRHQLPPSSRLTHQFPDAIPL
jgi:hypothetical protein